MFRKERIISVFSALGLAIAMLFTLHSCSVQPNYNYEMVSMGVGAQGTALVKVYAYTDTLDEAIENAKRTAMEGIMFKGIAGGRAAYRQPAMVKSDEHARHRGFFKRFFEKGEYLRFVQQSNDGSVGYEDRVRVGNKYKIGVVVAIDKTALRQYLEEEGIIKGLGSMFD